MKLLDLAGERRWCAWRTEFRGAQQKPTKVPYGAGGRLFESNNPNTWITLAEAQATGLAVGIALGPLGDGVHSLIGIDYDTCVTATGVTAWAQAAMDCVPASYTELSPSLTGIHQFFLVTSAELEAVRAAAGIHATGTGRRYSAGGGDHAPAIELYVARRFFALTLDPWETLLLPLTGAHVTALLAGPVALWGSQTVHTGLRARGTSVSTLGALWNQATDLEPQACIAAQRIEAAATHRPKLNRLLTGDHTDLKTDRSDSAVFWHINDALVSAGWSRDEREELFLTWVPSVTWLFGPKHAHAWRRELDRTLDGHDHWIPGNPHERALTALPIIEGTIITDNESWKNLLQVAKNKEYRGNLNNARMALLEAPALKNMLAFNEFSDRIVVQRCPPYEKSSEWNGVRDYADRDCIQIAAWLQAEGLQIEPARVLDASVAVSWEFRYDPVRAYLESVEQAWDGIGRLNLWMTTYLGVLPSTYTQAVASMSMIGSVARVFEPGCKKDTLTLLEGVQGIYKSSTLSTLYGQEYFVDHIPDIANKDALMQLAGKWCVEHAEMDRLSKAEASKVKAFLSTQVDVYRRPYGRVTQPVPRRCVFWGTINPNNRGYLTDETGNRRFWPVQCADAPINLRQLRDVRDQLWAEATRRYMQGERWWMSGQAERQQVAQVARRFDEDVWTSKIKLFLGPLESVSIAEVLRNGLGVTDDKQTVPAQNRVARVLRAMGLNRRQVRHGPFREWRYVKPGKPAKSNIVPFRQSGDTGDSQ